MAFLNVILLVLAFMSGLAAVTVQNQSRADFIELDRANREEEQLEQEYARLKLAQAKLANHQLIKVAAEKQKMKLPELDETKIIDNK